MLHERVRDRPAGGAQFVKVFLFFEHSRYIASVAG
jgi:hypothetical protein